MNTRSLPFSKPLLSAARAAEVPVDLIEQSIVGWLLDCQVRKLSPRTIEKRRMLTGKLIWYFRTEGIQAATTNTLRQFLGYVGTGHLEKSGRWGYARKPKANWSKRPASGETILSYHSTIRTLFRWMVEEEIIEVSPFEPVKPAVSRPDQVQPFTDEQLHAILAAAKASSNPYRDYAICLLLLDTGIRAAELVGLRFKDIDLSGHRSRVLGKGGKERDIAWSSACGKALWKHLRRTVLAPDDFVFQSCAGRRVHEGMRREALMHLVRRLCQAAGIESGKRGPHRFRHTFAVDFLRQGGNVFALKERLGHTSLAQSMRYVEYAQADIHKQAVQFSPADRITGR